MHLAIAAHDFYPDPGSGGTGRYVYETARRLVDRGHSVTVLTRRRGDVPARGVVEGVDVVRYDFHVAGHSAGEILRQVPGVVRDVSARVGSISPDLVSVQGPVTGVVLNRLVDDDVPRSTTFHSPWPTEYLLRTRNDPTGTLRRRLNASLRRQIERSLLGRADDVVTLSRFMSDQLCAVYGPVHEPTIVPGGVDVERYRPDAAPASVGTPDAAAAADGGTDVDREAPPRLDAEGTAFLTVRRLAPRMGHDLLLDAFASQAASSPDDRLYIAGEGPLRASLERRAARLGIEEQVTFLGYVADAALPATYAGADVFVLPTTRLEGFGLATLEALASGTPVVGTPVGGTVEILSPLEREAALPEAMLAPAADEASLESLLGRWSDLTDGARERAGRAGRQYACREYTWGRAVDELETRYGTLVERAG